MEKKAKVLVVDDQEISVTFLERVLVKEGYDVVTANDGVVALEQVEKENPDIILLDVRMPRMDGFEVCKRVKDDPEKRMVPIILITALTDTQDKIKGIEVGADDYINKPFNKYELLVRIKALLKVKFLNQELEEAENILFSLARIIEARDKFTKGHTDRVAKLAVAVAKKLNLSKEEVEALRKGAILHDIGKIAIPDVILTKSGPLTADELKKIREHTVVGEEICKPLKAIKEAMPVIRSHHEKLDGSGYPDGLKGDKISKIAKIMGVVDIYDTLIYDRSYGLGMPREEVFKLLVAEAEKGWWDREVLNVLMEMVKE